MQLRHHVIFQEILHNHYDPLKAIEDQYDCNYPNKLTTLTKKLGVELSNELHNSGKLTLQNLKYNDYSEFEQERVYLLMDNYKNILQRDLF